MTIVVGFVSEKGGVGKTTSCYHIAISLNWHHSKKVLVIDADYQRGGITGRFFPNLIENFRTATIPGETLYNKYQMLYSAAPFSPSVDIRQSEEGVDVLVADKRLANITVDKLPSTDNMRENNLALLEHLRIIDRVVKGLSGAYDYILIDSHPEISAVLRSIIYASNYCVSPVKLDLQSSIGVPTIISEIESVNIDALMMKNTLVTDLDYSPTLFAGAMGMMAREYGGDLKHSEKDERRRLQGSGMFFRNYVTEGDGLRIAAQQRVPVFNLTFANAVKQSSQLKALTEEFMQKCR